MLVQEIAFSPVLFMFPFRFSIRNKHVWKLSWVGSEENSYLSAALLCSHWSPWDLNGIKLIFEVCIYPVVLKKRSLFLTDKWLHVNSESKFSDKWPLFHPVTPGKVAGCHIYTPVDVYLYLLCKNKCEINIASVKQRTRLLCCSFEIFGCCLKISILTFVVQVFSHEYSGSDLKMY